MEETKKLVNVIIEKLCSKNLDYWWYDLDEEIQEEIKDELVKLILPVVVRQSEQLKCKHTWIVNHHRGTKYCSKGCDNFKKYSF